MPEPPPPKHLTGTWIVTVGAGAFTSLQIYTHGGSVLEDAGWPARRTTAHGSWEHVRERLYAATTVFFRFDPQTGARIGSEKINRTIRLDRDGRTFAAVAEVTQFDTNGDVTGQFTARSSGERMAVERIALEP